MKKLYIYLLFVILGILIYILLNHRDNFSIGAPYIVESEQMSDGDGYDSRLVLNFTPIHDRQFMSFNDLDAFFHNYSESGDQLPAIYLGEFEKRGSFFWNRRHFFIIGEYLLRFTKDRSRRYFPVKLRDFQLFRFDPQGASSGGKDPAAAGAHVTINIETVGGTPELIITDINGISMRLRSVVGSNSLQRAQYVITKYLDSVNSPTWLGRDVCGATFVDAKPVNMNTVYLEDIEETFRTTESLIDSEKCSNFRKILPINLANVFQGVTPVSSVHMDINISTDIRARARDVQYLIRDGHLPGSIQCVIDGNRIPLDAVDIISSGGGGIVLMYSQKTELPAGWARIPTGVLVQGAPLPLTIKYTNERGTNPSTIRPRELNTLFYAVAIKIFLNAKDPEIDLINGINSIDTQGTSIEPCDIINARILTLVRGDRPQSVAIMEVKDGTLLELELVDATKIMEVFKQIVTTLKCLVDAGYYYIDLKLENILYKCYNDSSLKISFGDLGGMISGDFYEGFRISATYIAPEWFSVTEEELQEAFPSTHQDILAYLHTTAESHGVRLSDVLHQYPMPSEGGIIWVLGVNLIRLFEYIRRQIPSIFNTIQVVNGSVDVNGEYTYTARTPTSSPVYSKDGNLWIFRNKTIAGGLGLREWVIVEASEWLPVWTVYSRQTQSTSLPENVKYAYHSIEGVDTTRTPPSSKWKDRENEDIDIIINQPFNLEIFRYPDLKYNSREHYLQVVRSNIQYLIDKLNTYARSGLHDSDDFVSTIPKIIEILQGIFLPRNDPEGQPLPRMNLEEVLAVLG